MGILEEQLDMIAQVATALDDLASEVVFVGGCVTGLLVNDPYTMEQIRFTEDVDLIVNVVTQGDWRRLQAKLIDRGFKEDLMEDVICRMNLGNLKVDIMPTEENILGFSNLWYKPAMFQPMIFEIKEGITVRVIASEYFVATKLEAWLGRGQNDVLVSHDVEDILTVIDGRSSLVDEILKGSTDVREYISEQFKSLLDDDNFQYVIQSVSRNDQQREHLILKKLKQCILD